LTNPTPPKILITTSRNPTQRIRTFCNDLTHTLPNSIRINRGKSSLNTLAEKALEHEAERIIIADRWKGNLGKIQLFTLGDTGLIQFYPIIYVKSVKLRRDFGHTRGKTAKSLILQTTPEIPSEARKLADALTQFLNTPKQPTDNSLPPNTQIIMHISLNPTRRIQITFLQTPEKNEIGPRITISHLIWKPRK
jgi:U3 small nucleolar ribonucleoprotein protein IMP4